MNEATNVTQTNYLAGGFQYQNNVLQFFPHVEGYVKHETNNYSYVFNYTDHLGNIRLSYSDMDKNGRLGNEKIVACSPPNPETGVQNCLSYFISSILEESHYYPFGLKHSGYNMNNSQPNYQYKYNGKELQTELGLNMYDFHARLYNPTIGRTPVQDVHAENYYSLSPYSFLGNNPLVFVDPDGKDIYRYDNKTGGLVLMQETEDKFDQIANYKYDKKTKEYTLETDRKGNAKTRVNNIAKGILKDGINFKENNNIIEVNGAGQPTEQNVIDFLVAYSDNVAKVEISGYGLNDGGSLSENISAMLVWQHKNNRWNQASDLPYDKNLPIYSLHRGDYKGKSRFAKYHYHTHPKVGQYKGADINEASEDDYNHKSKAHLPHFIFNINGRFSY